MRWMILRLDVGNTGMAAMLAVLPVLAALQGWGISEHRSSTGTSRAHIVATR